MTPRTTRVRIPAGNWSAFGMTGDNYVSAKRSLYTDDLEEGERYCWVEAVARGVVSAVTISY